MVRNIWDSLVALYYAVIGIGESVISIAEYFVSVVADILFITLYIGQLAVGGILNWFSWMPIVLVSVLAVLIGIAVIYKILGRE